VVDHGYSLQSIYGHLREIDVKVGDMVKKGQKMGIAGQTGLAGGVHVHFGMQIDASRSTRASGGMSTGSKIECSANCIEPQEIFSPLRHGDTENVGSIPQKSSVPLCLGGEKI